MLNILNFKSFFSTSEKYPFKFESKEISPGVKLESYFRVHPDSVIKFDFIEGKSLNCLLFFYDENGKKIEFSLAHDFTVKNGKSNSNSKPVVTKKIDGVSVLMQKHDFDKFKFLAVPHLETLKKQEKVGEVAFIFFETHLR